MTPGRTIKRNSHTVDLKNPACNLVTYTLGMMVLQCSRVMLEFPIGFLEAEGGLGSGANSQSLS